MKTYIISIFCFLCTTPFILGQSLNFSNTSTDINQIANVSFGYEYSMSTRLAYGYKMKTQTPIWLLVDVAAPMGNTIFDDLKTRLGVQAQVISMKKFTLSTRAQANVRTYQQKFVSMNSFGAEISGILAWSTSKWALECELGFDKAIVTHLNHTDLFRESYADIKDGWYLPTGGNWHYGFTVGRSIGKMMQISLSLGRTKAQGNDVNALIPLYLQTAVAKSF